MSIRKYIRRNVYRWHRTISLVIAVPVMLWALSGCLHPIMSTLKPKVNTEALPPARIDADRILVPLKQALAKHQIEEITRFRIVRLNERYYYQVAREGLDTLTYISCEDATILSAGDRMYAAHLAKRYINEPVQSSADNHKHHGRPTALKAQNGMTRQDNYRGRAIPSIKSVDFVTTFNSAYKRSNVFLPVYRVRFNRSDSITLYVETSGGRLAYAADAKRIWFTRFFSITHTWSFLDGWGKWKSWMLGSFSALCFLSSVFGFYVYNMVNKKSTNSRRKQPGGRLWHRTTGNFFLITTLLFSFSGAWHSYSNTAKDKSSLLSVDRAKLSCKELDFSLTRVMKTINKGESLCGVSAVKMNDRLYLLLTVYDGEQYNNRLIDVQTYRPLAEGESQFGRWLASRYAGKGNASILSVRHVNRFNDDYNMMYRRLPVVEVAFRGNENYYVETSTGCLSAITNGSSRAERFSFSNLHMHHFWKMWFGKEIGQPVRNMVLIISTSGLLILAMTGMLMYINKLRRRTM